MPIIEWRGGPLARVSIQGYNILDDVEAPIAALRVLLREVQTPRRSGSWMGTGLACSSGSAPRRGLATGTKKAGLPS